MSRSRCAEAEKLKSGRVFAEGEQEPSCASGFQHERSEFRMHAKEKFREEQRTQTTTNSFNASCARVGKLLLSRFSEIRKTGE